MVINRKELLSRFPWLQEKNLSMVVSADYDGLICAAFLHHYLNWKLEGYYDLSNIWISNKGIQEKKNLIWVDLNILPRQGRAIGGHIISLSKEIPRIGNAPPKGSRQGTSFRQAASAVFPHR